MLVSPKPLSLFSALDVVNLFDAELVLDDFDLIHIPLLVSNITVGLNHNTLERAVALMYGSTTLDAFCQYLTHLHSNISLLLTSSHLSFPRDHVASKHQWLGIVLYYTITRHIATKSTIDPSSQTNLKAKLLRTILDHQILRTSKVGYTLQEFQGHGQWHHLSGCGNSEALVAFQPSIQPFHILP